MMHLCVSVRVRSVANQLVRHGIEHIWIHRLQKYFGQSSGEFYWRYQFTFRNREYVTGWENGFLVIMMMLPCWAEAFPQDLPSHCCQQSLQAHWVCIRNCVKIVLILENSSLSFLTRQGACYNMQWRHGSRLWGSSSSLQVRPLRTLRQRWWPLPE